MRIAQLQSEIVNRVKAIEQQKSDKKDMQSGYNATIKILEEEKLALLQDLEEAQREELIEEADEILINNQSSDLVVKTN